MRIFKSITIKSFNTNLSDSDIENIVMDNFQRFVKDFQIYLAAGYQSVSWVND